MAAYETGSAIGPVLNTLTLSGRHSLSAPIRLGMVKIKTPRMQIVHRSTVLLATRGLLWTKKRLEIYTDWANHYLEKARNKRHINDLQNDVADGVLLAEVIEAVSK
ncbi:hypothetical protein RRG08_021121 [Elysia crispata]|uniref:Calponin-homology (CH) domain-containing protein n=1 Tax=Elysia crispata TaxID=231223 RepID=A0AAE0Z5J5_9GAST|nr:hypothetical protein RRG08_021121 [Elysia crispata]